MIKKFIFLSFCYVATAHAEICPSPDEIRSAQLRNWVPRNIDSAEPLSQKQFSAFQKNVRKFESASWMPDAPEGAGQCYYLEMNAYLTKDTNPPDETQGNWHTISLDNKSCNQSISLCAFSD